MPALEISDLVVEYTSGEYVVRPIDGLDLVAEDGEIVVLLGPSGCGKTTLLSCIGGILAPTSGTIRTAGADITTATAAELAAHRRHRVGIVFQGFNLIPSLTALDNVAAPLLTAGVPARRARGRARELLATVELGDRADHRPARLSGGQQQRVAIARALAHDPPIVLADEPTANLDHIQAEGVIRLLRDLRGPGRLIVVSTHDDRLVPAADRVVEMVPRFRTDSGPPAFVSVPRGEIVFEQGARGELVYVVEAGTIEVVRQRADGQEERLATFGTGEYFGELAAMLGFPRSATARALTDTTLTAYSVRDFRERVLREAGPTREPVTA